MTSTLTSAQAQVTRTAVLMYALMAPPAWMVSIMSPASVLRSSPDSFVKLCLTPVRQQMTLVEIMEVVWWTLRVKDTHVNVWKVSLESYLYCYGAKNYLNRSTITSLVFV